MTKKIFTRTHLLEVLLMFGCSVSVGILLAVVYTSQQTPHVTQMPNLPVKLAQPANTSSLVSPDGSKTLVMKTLQSAAGSTTYSFFVTSSATESGRLIFTTIADSNTHLSIPFNTWSPDNRYFFIQKKDATQAGTLVFKASGETFNAQPFIDVSTVFAEKKSGYNLAEVTGWAAPTLLIVNTQASDQASRGPSYWFDISRQSLIRLSTLFE